MDNQNEINPKQDIVDKPKEQLKSLIICNPSALKIYKALLGGRYSIFTSHNAFLYQYFLAKFNNEPLALSLQNLSAEDLEILKALGNLILLNGGNPKYISNLGNFWSARYISYPTTRAVGINYLIKLINEQLNLMNKFKINQNQTLINELNKIINIKQNQLEILKNYI